MRIMRRYNKHQYVHPSKNIIVAWLCFGVLRWDMTTAHYVISWSQVWRHISWISTFISMYTHDFIRQMQGLKIFKGSIITSAITTRAASNTTSSPTFLQNYTLQTKQISMECKWSDGYIATTLSGYYLFYKICMILLMKPQSELLKAAEKFVVECKNASTAAN